MKNTTICVASLLGGMVIGSALAMLLTPQSGHELRHQIRDAFNREIDKARQEMERVREELEQARCHCNEKTNE